MIYYASSDRFVISQWMISHRLLYFTTNHNFAPGAINHALVFSLADYVDTIFEFYGIVVEDATESEVAALRDKFVLRNMRPNQADAENDELLVSAPAKDVRDQYKYFALRTQGRSCFVIAMGFYHRAHTGGAFIPLMKMKPFEVKIDSSQDD